MAHLKMAEPEQLQANAEALQYVEEAMGFTPNSLKIMARNSTLLNAFLSLSSAIMGPGAKLNPGLRQMIAYISSTAAGCRYCQAHTAHASKRAGLSAEKTEAIRMYETNSLFTEAERAALAFAQAGGAVHNEVTKEHFEALTTYYTEDEVLEIVGIIAYFGFLNRWNDTLATDLEESPLTFASAHLAASGWEKGKHG